MEESKVYLELLEEQNAKRILAKQAAKNAEGAGAAAEAEA